VKNQTIGVDFGDIEGLVTRNEAGVNKRQARREYPRRTREERRLQGRGEVLQTCPSDCPRRRARYRRMIRSWTHVNACTTYAALKLTGPEWHPQGPEWLFA
jgi:hypothetical protein